MPPQPILGLHHVTATVERAQPDVDFCTGALGLRLVKKTVNFDNRHVYHFYYGTERGAPGTIWTTFPYHGWNVRAGIHGAGQVTATALSVPRGARDAWLDRLEARGVRARERTTPFGEPAIDADDPSGLRLVLVETADDPRAAWTGAGMREDTAVRGLHSVTLTVHSRGATVDLLTGLLGFRRVDEAGAVTRLAAGDGRPGALLDVVEDPSAPRGVNGIGTVHHVAFAITNGEEQRRLRDELIASGREVTDVRDRQYFQSIYFREPGGVLFEVATVTPGFTFDEPLAHLGEALKLPPWEESNRALIESGLPPITTQ